jgi:hypothetical protein
MCFMVRHCVSKVKKRRCQRRASGISATPFTVRLRKIELQITPVLGSPPSKGVLQAAHEYLGRLAVLSRVIEHAFEPHDLLR